MNHEEFIAALVEEERDFRGISVAELARRASVEPKRLWRILHGEREMKADEFVRLCVVLGLDFRRFVPKEMVLDLQEHRSKMAKEFGSGIDYYETKVNGK